MSTALPKHLGKVAAADTSRLLSAAEERNWDRKAQHAPTVAYRRVSTEGGHV
ncbi:hypothetical protein [Paenibacillus sp. GCM10027626]|uniref:hypothetical protein n=1 Tax=Paenibacillus sp. GCM10027626 TaxID=3273411 RepID=UPI00363988AA